MTIIHPQPTQTPVPAAPIRGQTVFVISTPVRDLEEFRALAQQATHLQPFGRVEVNIASLANKGRHEIPAGGSPWHEYAAWNPTLFKFFPHQLIAPFIPADFVNANRDLLLAKAQILRNLGLGAAFWSYEPNFLPERFFETYPHLRGPRVDHPRRSRHEEFALCVDSPDAQEMIADMVRQLVQHVPELGTFYFKTNDAGPGLCWSDWQYSGANGPSHCRHHDMGRRVRGLFEAILQGARDAGGKLQVHMTGNFSRTELKSIHDALPADCFVRNMNNTSLCLNSMVDVCYPVRGIFEPLGLLHGLQKLRSAWPRAMFIDLRSYYDRGGELPDVAHRIIDLVAGFLAEPSWGLIDLLQRLRQWCDQWAGEAQGLLLFDALVKLHETLKFKQAALPGLSAIYGGVSLRYITRPLLFDPTKLTGEDEAYFLPHVFNVSVERGRLDYLDIHGTRLAPAQIVRDLADPRLPAAHQVQMQLEDVARMLDSLTDSTAGAMLRDMGRAIRIYAGVLRSCANFYAAQIIRDRHPINSRQSHAAPSPLAGAGPVPGAFPGAGAGDPDLLLFNEIMRDELDNAQAMIDLLKEGGSHLLCHARTAAEEDTFLLGADLIPQLHRKRKLMRQHWLDIQNHLSTPMK